MVLLLRYEEDVSINANNHNRLPAKESGLSKTNKSTELIVGQIVLEICDRLKQQNPEIKFKQRQFKFINTIDVDQAWKYQYYLIRRNVLAIGKQFVSLDFSGLKERISVISSKQKDPYFQFDFLKNLHYKYKLETIFFWQVGKSGR